MNRFRPTGLWRNPAFLHLWVGQAISQVGSQVSFLALPLLAVVILKATPVEMGLLTAAGAVPSLLFGLPAGAIIDRHARLPLMIASDVARALLLALIPLLWSLDVLTMGLLYPIAFLMGAMGLIFDVAYQALLPALVRRERLIDANSKLELSRTAAEIAGPGLAGWLVGLVTAPLAITVDALSFAVSAILLGRMRGHATDRPTGRAPGSDRLDSVAGVRLVLGDERLRALIGSRAALNLFNAMLEAVFVLYIVRSLGISATLLGIAFSIGSLGFVLGALLPQRLASKIGIGRALAGGIAVAALSDLLIPLVRGQFFLVIGTLITAEFCFGLGLTVFNISQASLRQALVPDAFLGRVGATAQALNSALIPLGALLGGVAGQAFGLRETLILAACGELLAAMWIWASPLWRMVALPDAASLPPMPDRQQPNRECRSGGDRTVHQGFLPRVSPCS